MPNLDRPVLYTIDKIELYLKPVMTECAVHEEVSTKNGVYVLQNSFGVV